MAFWKKSEDPWDRKPKKQSPVGFCGDEIPQKQKENPIPDWYRTEEIPAPVACPWCGKPMLYGVLYGSGRAMQWREGPYRGGLDAMRFNGWKIDLGGSEAAWYCTDCRKVTIDIEGMLEKAGPNYVWKDGKPCPVEEEEHDDL